jgi:hypothetical protein
MKLWLIKAREDLPKGNNPWASWYDCTHGVVIRAETEEEARAFITNAAWEDEDDQWPVAGDEVRNHPNAWMSPEYSTCEELIPDGAPGLVIRDFHAG